MLDVVLTKKNESKLKTSSEKSSTALNWKKIQIQ